MNWLIIKGNTFSVTIGKTAVKLINHDLWGNACLINESSAWVSVLKHRTQPGSQRRETAKEMSNFVRLFVSPFSQSVSGKGRQCSN